MKIAKIVGIKGAYPEFGYTYKELAFELFPRARTKNDKELEAYIQRIVRAIDAPINQYFYLFSGTACTAMPNKGFEFSSWVENLQHNSTRAIKTSKGSDSILTPLLNVFGSIPNDTEATINAQFGSYTANFRALPPPIPPAYWIPLYGVIISSIVGWSIPSIIGWIKAKRQRGSVNQYIKMINSHDDKLDENGIESLDRLKRNILDAYAEGKISDQHYKLLNEKISDLKINHESINKLSSSQEISKAEESPIKYNESKAWKPIYPYQIFS